jgi:hypothetical protein
MRILCSLVIFLFLICLFTIRVYPQEAEETETEKDWESWHFNASPYFWFVGLNGTLIVPEAPPVPGTFPEEEVREIEIDIGFKDVKNSIKYAMMFSGQYRNERISVVMNYTHLILQGEAITPYELVIQGTEYRFRHVSGDLSFQYRLIKTKKWNIDAGFGVKFLSDKAEALVNFPVDTSIDLNRSVSWVDPVISTVIKYIPHPKVEIAAYVDFGSGLIGDRSYQTIAGITYRFTPLFHMTAGYRVWGVKKDLDTSVFKGNLNGWITRVGFRF